MRASQQGTCCCLACTPTGRVAGPGARGSFCRHFLSSCCLPPPFSVDDTGPGPPSLGWHCSLSSAYWSRSRPSAATMPTRCSRPMWHRRTDFKSASSTNRRHSPLLGQWASLFQVIGNLRDPEARAQLADLLAHTQPDDALLLADSPADALRLQRQTILAFNLPDLWLVSAPWLRQEAGHEPAGLRPTAHHPDLPCIGPRDPASRLLALPPRRSSHRPDHYTLASRGL